MKKTIILLLALTFAERWQPVQDLLDAQALDWFIMKAQSGHKKSAWCQWTIVQAGVCNWRI